MRPVQYLLRDQGFGAEIVAGPIPAFDDDQFEKVLIGFLKEHPFDDDVLYQVLFLDEKATPSIEEIMTDYLEPLIAEAWGFTLPESDEDDEEDDGRDDPQDWPEDRWGSEGGRSPADIYKDSVYD